MRCVTEYAITAYRPTAASRRAIAAKIANMPPKTRYCQRRCASSSSIVRTLNTGMSASSASTACRISGTAAAVPAGRAYDHRNRASHVGPGEIGHVDDRVGLGVLNVALPHDRGDADDGLRPEIDSVGYVFL